MRVDTRPGLLISAFALFLSWTSDCRELLAQESGIRVPDGFAVELYADDDLAHDIHSLTIDAKGRVVVSGPGYVRTLIDSDNDGKADRFQLFADRPATGSQGMFFLGNHLLCSGDEGLQIFRDDNGDGTADGPPQVFMKIAAGGEHHVHSIQKGPDGWWYIVAGNFSGVTKAYATTPTSPLRDPVSGTLLRLRPDLSGGEIVADGFRNTYDFAFNGTGDFFTYDSDDERDISMPWYLPTQVFHILPMSNAGYVTPGLKHPPTYPDMPPVLAQFGRGSPTGVLCYQHHQFPPEYQGAIFAQDWTLGRILMVPLELNGAGWKSEPKEFAVGQNQFGFAPTDMEVGPDGSLFVSVGGRGTRGSVFRIRYTTPVSPVVPFTPGTTVDEKVNAVLKAEQPNTSWSRANWHPLSKSLGADVFRAAALDEARPNPERIRAIEILVEQFGGLDGPTSAKLADAGPAVVRARAAWAIGRTKPEAPDAQILKKFLSDRDVFVQRFALEALTSVTGKSTYNQVLNEIARSFVSEDRLVRLTAAQLVIRLQDDQKNAIRTALAGHPKGLMWFSIGRLMRTSAMSITAAEVATNVLTAPASTVATKKEAVRLLQLAVGDMGPAKDRPPMFESYAPRFSLEPIERELNPLLSRIFAVFPTGDHDLDHELIRFFAMTAPLNRELFSKLLAGITADSLPQDDLHRLAAISRFEIERSVEETMATAAALVGIDVKIRRLNMRQDTNWDDRMGELYAALCKVDPALPSMIADQPGFGLPGHVLFLSVAPQSTIPKAIDGIVKTIAADPDYAWSNDIVFTIGESPNPEHQALLRKQLDNLSVRDAVLMVLAEKPVKEDRALYLSGLESAQLNAVEACLRALTKLPRSNDAAEQYQLLNAARRLINDKREFQLRELAMRLLQNNTSQTLGFVFGEPGYKLQPESMQSWQQWLEQRYPDYRPVSRSEVAQKILASLNDVPWDAGDLDRGKQLFEKQGCAKCHGGRRALGPDLTGVSRRFSRNDLFAAIVEPNRDISPRYQTTSVETKAGKILTGLIVYESVDGLLLRDAEHKTYRVEAADIESKHLQRNSLMPEGLLKDSQPQDLADLAKYLQSL
ncbi:MAG: c-type cytochrome [Planctomycetaceae bacterium]|nr:c-type cytochrome [Planctomycetaceae bacterium]